MKDLGSIYRATKLKDMDSAALVFAILHEIDTDRVDRTQLGNALELATAAHLSQKRIGRAAYPVDPYIVHPLRNVLRLIRLGAPIPMFSPRQLCTTQSRINRGRSCRFWMSHGCRTN